MTVSATSAEVRGFIVAPFAGTLVSLVSMLGSSGASGHAVLASFLLIAFMAYGSVGVAMLLWFGARRLVPPSLALAVATGAIAAVLPLQLTEILGQYTALTSAHHLRDFAVAAIAGAVAGCCFWAIARPTSHTDRR